MLEMINKDTGGFQDANYLTAMGLPKSGNWVSFSVNHYGKEYICEAKVFSESSIFGIDGGRISKLTVYKKDGPMVYNYDRGLDFCEISHVLLDKIIRIFP